MGWLKDILFGPQRKNNDSSSPDDGWKNANGEPVMDHLASTINDPVEGQAVNSEDIKPAADPFRDEGGNKLRPVVEVERVKANTSNNSKHLELWVTIKNQSEFAVEVKQLQFLGQRAGGYYLKPGEAREFRQYSGDTPDNDADKTARLQYKIADNGDFFQADHFVTYDFEDNDGEKLYIPEDMRFIPPVRDI